MIEQLLTCIFARGHALLMGVPGLAKTLLVHSLADLMSMSFSRMQFTPDLMPSDITGTEILQETEQPGRRAFEFVKGPIFANIVLADEINRTPPKTQAALLQAMQEQKVNSGKHSFMLEPPFFVLATQNPDRAGRHLSPARGAARSIHVSDQRRLPERRGRAADREDHDGRRHAGARTRFCMPQDILRFQEVVRRVPVPDHVYEHAVKLVRKCRPTGEESPDWIKKWVMWGPGPRAVQYLVLGAKARAVLHGSYLVRLEDVHAVAEPVLAHRILVNFHAESEGINSLEIIKRIIAETAE